MYEWEEAEMEKLLQVEYIDQSVNWPTGCESVSTVMALRFLGMPITVDEFIQKCLACRSLTMKNGVQIGPDPNHFFIGDPHVDEDSYGCYAQAIVEAIGRAKKLYPEFAYQPVDLTGLATETLAEKYVAAGVPVIYWATMDMEPSGYYGAWTLENSGEQFIWKSHEHCLLLTGFEEEHYIFHDPWKNNGIVRHPKELVQKRHEEMYSMAVSFIPETRRHER